MSERRTDWRQVSRGLMLIGVACFLLLNTQGYLRWSFWLEALTFWPVLLVGLGLRLLFERSSVPWAILVSPLLMLGTLGYVAHLGAPQPVRDWSPVRAERPEGSRRWALEGQLALANLELEGKPLSPDQLVEGRASSGRGSDLYVTERGAGARVHLRNWKRHRPAFLFPRYRHWFDLGVARDLPLEVDLELVLTTGSLDVADTQLGDLRVKGAFNALSLHLGELGPEQEEIALRLAGAFNRLEVYVPATTPLKLRVEGPNFVDGRPDAGDLSGPGYRLRVDGAFNRVKILPAPATLPAEVEEPDVAPAAWSDSSP